MLSSGPVQSQENDGSENTEVTLSQEVRAKEDFNLSSLARRTCSFCPAGTCTVKAHQWKNSKPQKEDHSPSHGGTHSVLGRVLKGYGYVLIHSCSLQETQQQPSLRRWLPGSSALCESIRDLSFDPQHPGKVAWHREACL